MNNYKIVRFVFIYRFRYRQSKYYFMKTLTLKTCTYFKTSIASLRAGKIVATRKV